MSERVKVRDLLALLSLPGIERHIDDDVVVILSEPSMGTVANVQVAAARFGFDWDKGKFLLRTDKPVVKKSNKQALWHAAYDFIFMLSGETRRYRGEERLTESAKEARRMLEKCGLKPRKIGTFIPEEAERDEK